MKYTIIFCLILLANCTHKRGPASTAGHPIAHDSMALGNVRASALKRIDNQQVCFDISLIAKNVRQEQVQPSNWTFAWVDKNEQYHLLPVTQRQPASAPQGGVVTAPYGFHHEYSNNFTACAPQARMEDVKTLVLIPKDFPYHTKDGLRLSWE
jgi:hypothetical protein